MSDDAAYHDSNRAWESNWDRPDEDPYRSHEPRGWGCVAWLVILAVAGTMGFLRTMAGDKAEKVDPLDDSASLYGVMELNVRAHVGLGDVLRRLQPGEEDEIRKLFEGDPADPADQAAHKQMWTHGTFGQRLQYAIAGGDLAGPDSALDLLGRLKWDWGVAKLQPSAEQLAVFETLRKIYLDYRKKKFDAPSAGDAARQQLLKKLGWYGRLALTPPQAPDQVARNQVMESPTRLVVGIFAIFGVICLALIVGVVGLAVLALATLLGHARVGLRPGTVSSGIYAETFALWILGFVMASLLVELFARPADRLPLTTFVFFGSLSVLAWPVIRGISWQQVRSDIGLTWGRSGLLDPAWGIPGYAMMVPMLGIGLLMTFIALIVSGAGGAAAPQDPFEPQHVISHPIVDVILRGNIWVRLQLALLACVAAPIVEEIMFRGVLYRQMRDATGKAGWFGSCVISALVVSFIFAVIHPQGPIAVPALMGIACGCTLVREWRDSLWASMMVHAINNGLVLTLLLVASS